MTTEVISNYLSYFNKKIEKANHLTKNIYTMSVSDYDFFLIKGETKFVGIILNMYTDLHPYVSRKYRRQGYMSNAIIELVDYYKIQKTIQIYYLMGKKKFCFLKK